MHASILARRIPCTPIFLALLNQSPCSACRVRLLCQTLTVAPIAIRVKGVIRNAILNVLQLLSHVKILVFSSISSSPPPLLLFFLMHDQHGSQSRIFFIQFCLLSSLPCNAQSLPHHFMHVARCSRSAMHARRSSRWVITFYTIPEQTIVVHSASKHVYCSAYVNQQHCRTKCILWREDGLLCRRRMHLDSINFRDMAPVMGSNFFEVVTL